MKTLSNKGVMIDFGALIAKAGSTVAVGNARMNARGDILTHGGIIDKTAEQVADSYYRNNPRAVSHSVPLSSIEDEILTPAEALKKVTEEMAAAPKPRRKTSDE